MTAAAAPATIAVLGANGQLGTDLVRALRPSGRDAVRPLTHDEIDVADAETVRAALGRVRPQVVINCAAFHRVDECEERPEEAMRVNALGALHVARACAALGACCVHISTDYVFGAQGRAPYSEDDPPSPVNVYGVSKLAGEHLVAQACPHWLIVRVASLFGTTPPRGKKGNFVDAILAKARAGGPLRVVDDIRMSPTYTRDAAHALAALVRGGARGLVHVTNAGSCTWYEFAAHVLACAGSGADVMPVPAAEYPASARRPADSSLRSVRAAGYLGRPLRPWRDALREYLAARGAVEAAMGARSG